MARTTQSPSGPVSIRSWTLRSPERYAKAVSAGMRAVASHEDIDLRTINELFLLTQPAHLQKLHGKKLDGDARRQARAEYIRSRLNGN